MDPQDIFMMRGQPQDVFMMRGQPQDIFMMRGQPQDIFMMRRQLQKAFIKLTQQRRSQRRKVRKTAFLVSTHAQACVDRDCAFPGCREYKEEVPTMNCHCSPKYHTDAMDHPHKCSQCLYLTQVLVHANTCSSQSCSLYLCRILRSDHFKDLPPSNDKDKDFQEADPEQNENMDWKGVRSGYWTEEQGSRNPGHRSLISNYGGPCQPYRKRTSLFGRNGIRSGPVKVKLMKQEQVKKPRVPTLLQSRHGLRPFLPESTQKPISKSDSVDCNLASPDEQSAFSFGRNSAPAARNPSLSMSFSPQLPRDTGETSTSEVSSFLRYPDVSCLKHGQHPLYCPSHADFCYSSSSSVTEASDNGALSPTHSSSPSNSISEHPSPPYDAASSSPEALQSTVRASQLCPPKRLFADEDSRQPGSQSPHSDGSAGSGCSSPEGQDTWSSHEDGTSSPEYHPRSWSSRHSFQVDRQKLRKRERFQTARSTSPGGFDQRIDKRQRYRGMSSQPSQNDGGRDLGAWSSYAKGACSGITDMRRSPGRVNRSSYGQTYGQDAFQEESRQHPQYESFSLHRGTPAASPGILTRYKLPTWQPRLVSNSSEEYDSLEEYDSGEESESREAYPQHPESERFQPTDDDFHQLMNTDDFSSGNNADFENVTDGGPQAGSEQQASFPRC